MICPAPILSMLSVPNKTRNIHANTVLFTSHTINVVAIVAAATTWRNLVMRNDCSFLMSSIIHFHFFCHPGCHPMKHATKDPLSYIDQSFSNLYPSPRNVLIYSDGSSESFARSLLMQTMILLSAMKNSSPHAYSYNCCLV